MKKRLDSELKVGLFISIGIGLILLSILILGGNTFLTRSVNYYSSFNKTDGLVMGAKVTLNGVPVGAVNHIEFDYANHKIQVGFSVDKKAAQWVREGTSVEIATQGVLGDKYLSLSAGKPDMPMLPEGTNIPHIASRDITQVINRSDELILSLNDATATLGRILRDLEGNHRSEVLFQGLADMAKNMSQLSAQLNRQIENAPLKQSIMNLNQILEKINSGKGTLGALVNDPGVYDQIKALFGGANRNRVVRNLLRQTAKESANPKNSPMGAPTPAPTAEETAP